MTRHWERIVRSWYPKGYLWNGTDAGQGKSPEFWEYVHNEAAWHADNGVTCSCPACGNPRKWFGSRTEQERKADDSFRQQLGDWDDSWDFLNLC